MQLSLPKSPFILAIAGCSGSGKTTLARELTTQLDATLFPLDLYYRDLSHLPHEARDQQRPIYDFKTHSRVPNRTETLTPTSVVIVEGILALHYVDLIPLYHASVYVNAPNQVCLNRRIYRDMRERGRTEASVRAQFEATAKPMADRYVLPSQSRATLTVEGTDNLDWSVEQVLKHLDQLGLTHPDHYRPS